MLTAEQAKVDSQHPVKMFMLRTIMAVLVHTFNVTVGFVDPNTLIVTGKRLADALSYVLKTYVPTMLITDNSKSDKPNFLIARDRTVTLGGLKVGTAQESACVRDRQRLTGTGTYRYNPTGTLLIMNKEHGHKPAENVIIKDKNGRIIGHAYTLNAAWTFVENFKG